MTAPDRQAQLDAAMAEARQLLADLRSEVKEARRVLRDARRDCTEGAVQAAIEAAVERGLAEYNDTVKRAMDDAVAKVGREFDKLAATYIGKGGKQGPTLPEVAERAVERRVAAEQLIRGAE